MTMIQAGRNQKSLTLESVRAADEIAEFETRYGRLAQLVDDECVIPGLAEKFVPQGVTFMPGRRRLAMTLHDPEKRRPSRLAVVDIKSAELLVDADLFDEDGDAYFGHAGGVTVLGPWLWVCSARRMMRFALADVRPDRHELRADFAFGVDSRASFMCSSEAALWVGEFHHGEEYTTAEHHRCPIDDEKRAWIVSYPIDAATGRPALRATYEVEGERVHKPASVIFTRNKVQGAAFVRGMLALTVSWSGNDSKLAFYRFPADADPMFEVELPRGSTDGFVVNGDNWLATLDAPAGAQDLEADGKRLVTVFEGGAAKYLDRWRGMGAGIEDRALVLKVPGPRRLAELAQKSTTDHLEEALIRATKIGEAAVQRVEGWIRAGWDYLP